MTLNNEMNHPIKRDPSKIPAISDEASNGTKTVPTTLYKKSEDGTSFEEVDVGAKLDAINTKLDSIIENGVVNTQLTGSNVELLNEDLKTTLEPGEEKKITTSIHSPVIRISFIGSLRTTPDDYEVTFRYLNNEGKLVYKEIKKLSMSNDLTRGYFYTESKVKGTNVEIILKNASNDMADVSRLVVLGVQSELDGINKNAVISYDNVSDANESDFSYFYYGENSIALKGDNFIPFDVSNYRKKMVYLSNETDTTLNFRLAFYHKAHSIVAGEYTVRSNEFSVEPGDSILLTSDGEPLLSQPWQGMSTSVHNPPNSTGVYTVRMFGGI